MTTLQPRLVRADTLDLQSHNSPSAKDHSRSPTYSPYNHNAAGAHHREALRNAEESAYNDQMTNPHGSGQGIHNGVGDQYDSAEDDEMEDGQHGHLDGNPHHDGDYENGEIEDDDELDDDMLDKISSSPSIEDGKYTFSLPNPRSDTMVHGAAPASLPLPPRGLSPIPQVLPLNFRAHAPVIHRTQSFAASHQVGEYACGNPVDYGHEKDFYCTPVHTDGQIRLKDKGIPRSVSQDSIGSISKYLVSADDPALNEIPDESDTTQHFSDDLRFDDESNWVDESTWYEDGLSSDDDPDDFIFRTDSRFIDSGWGGECLREIEDIDFEFVYALHTFVATVEGQANATKGDTMVLLDDSNSYWWLVRVVKDGSIGYLPAEHIETPTERLARLNKHRNIDLAASMLGDNPEKSKNPLKKAMKRRNAKSVAFAAPTYYEPSEYNYSSEEDEDGEDLDADPSGQHQQAEQAASEEIIIADDTHDAGTNGVRKVASEDQLSVEPLSPVKIDAPGLESQQDEVFQRTRNGVVRNTDSFFKDDTAETKKISLTPRLLRGDSETTTAASSQPMSNDTFDRLLGEDKGKEEKKKKEKKGMLSGFFKRKDKKSGKNETDEMLSPDESLASPTSKDSMESVSNPQSPVERKSSKLQKAPPGVVQPKSSSSDIKAAANPSIANVQATATPPQLSQPQAVLDTASPPTLASSAPPMQQSEPGHSRTPSHTDKRSIFAPITTVLKSTSAATEDEQPVKPVYSKRAKERFAIDTSDSEDDTRTTMKVPAPARHSISPILDTDLHKSRPDSAMQVSPIDSADEQEHLFHTLDKSISTGEEEEALTPTEGQGQSDTASTSKPSPSLATHTPSTSRSTPTWSDASLRTYMDNDQDIRDLLIIIHDKSNVTPIGPDHPLMGNLFTAERSRLAEMQSQLDTMLTSWISKKNPHLLAK